jgi:hypothetical protein
MNQMSGASIEVCCWRTFADERPGTSESSAQAAQVRELADNHRTGLTLPDENAKLTDCYYEKKDWRACKAEVSLRSRKLNLGRRDAAEPSQTTIVSFFFFTVSL